MKTPYRIRETKFDCFLTIFWIINCFWWRDFIYKQHWTIKNLKTLSNLLICFFSYSWRPAYRIYLFNYSIIENRFYHEKWRQFYFLRLEGIRLQICSYFERYFFNVTTAMQLFTIIVGSNSNSYTSHTLQFLFVLC